MTCVPPETEDAAREVARLYELTEEEVDRLASDHRFAALAYLRRETGEWLEPLGYPITGGTVDVDDDGELVVEDVETVDGETDYGRAVALAWYGYRSYVEASEAIAEAILGRPIEESDLLGDLLAEAVVETGGEL
jgi:hypothetical protein